MFADKIRQAVRESKPESWSVLLGAFSASYGIGLIALLGLPFMFGSTMKDLQLSEFQAGMVGTVEFLAIMLASVAAAPFMHLPFRRGLAFLGAAIALIGNLVCIDLPILNFEMALGLRAFTGIGCGLAVAVGNATVSNAKNTEKMAAQMSTLFTVLMAITMVVFSWASENGGYKGVYGVLAGCTAILLPTLFFIPKGPVEAAQNAVDQAPASKLFSLPSLLILFATFIFAMRDMSSWAFVERLGMGTGLSQQQVGQLLSLQALVGIIGPLAASMIGSRFGIKAPLILGILTSGAVYFFMLLIPNSQAVFVTTAMFIGGTYFFALSYLTALAAELDPSGRIVAASGGFLSAGIAAGPIVGGYFVGVFGFRGTSFVILAMVVATLVFALGAAKANQAPKVG